MYPEKEFVVGRCVAAELAPSCDGSVLALRTPASAAHISSRTSTGIVTRDMWIEPPWGSIKG
jgi:hypothetical protein